MSKDNLIVALKAHYTQSASLTVPLGAKTICRQFAGGAWPIASSFIRLAILLSSEEKYNDHPNFDCSLTLARYEDIRAVKMSLEPNQISKVQEQMSALLQPPTTNSTTTFWRNYYDIASLLVHQRRY